MVREHDRPRYYATLFAQPALRADLFAIYGFAAEIAGVPDQVREPHLGEIRLKWWSDALVEAIGGGGGETPSLRAVAAAITRLALPIAPFIAMIEARGADLYSDPPGTFADLEGRMGETQSVLFQMTAIASGAASAETADAAGHAGVAYGVARRLASFASDRARGRIILPSDLLAEHGTSAAEALASRAPDGLHRAVSALANFARRHLILARERAVEVPEEARLAFLPLAVVGPLLSKVERRGAAVADKDAELANLESLIRIGWSRVCSV